MADGLRNKKAVFQEVLQIIKIRQDGVRKRKSQSGQEDYFKVGDRVLKKKYSTGAEERGQDGEHSVGTL